MAEVLKQSALKRWRDDPASFITEVCRDPETDQPFVLLNAERKFLKHAFRVDGSGRLRYPEQVFSAPKKSGKTGFAALHLLTTTLLYGGKHAEGYCIANDLEQATARVFEAARRIVDVSPYLRREAKVTRDRIEFPATKAVITALASDYAGAAGANPVISVFDELWAYSTERSRRLWDEMVPVPTRKISCRLTVTYAGFEGESLLLEELYKHGLQQRVVGRDLYAGSGLLMLWSHRPIAPWQDQRWLKQMRGQLRPNAFLRMIENRFVSTELTFIEMDWWDACVDPHAFAMIADQSLAVYVGVDASVKHDSTAIVAVHWDYQNKKARVVWHRIFQPSPDRPLDFEATVEDTIRDLHRRFNVRAVKYDPYQMQAVAQRLLREGIRMEEFPQSVPNLTAASQNLYELIKSNNLIIYPDSQIRLAVSRAIAIETPRGLRIAKDKQSHKIDVVVALGLAAYGAVQATCASTYTLEHIHHHRDLNRRFTLGEHLARSLNRPIL